MTWAVGASARDPEIDGLNAILFEKGLWNNTSSARALGELRGKPCDERLIRRIVRPERENAVAGQAFRQPCQPFLAVEIGMWTGSGGNPAVIDIKEDAVEPAARRLRVEPVVTPRQGKEIGFD